MHIATAMKHFGMLNSIPNACEYSPTLAVSVKTSKKLVSEEERAKKLCVKKCEAFWLS